MAVCTITSRSHGNGKTDIGLSNLDMPTKRVSFSHSPTTAIMKNMYLLTEVNNTPLTPDRPQVKRPPPSLQITSNFLVFYGLSNGTTLKKKGVAVF